MTHHSKLLKDLITISLLPEEDVIEVERQHWIVFFYPMLLNSVVLILLFAIAAFLISLQILPITFGNYITAFILFSLSFLSVVGTYVFMDWYYTFYIITNKRLMHARYFRLGGHYSEEVFLRASTARRIERTSANIIYDMFDIEDVWVHFYDYEVPEPFVFRTPANSLKIKNIIEDLYEKKKK